MFSCRKCTEQNHIRKKFSVLFVFVDGQEPWPVEEIWGPDSTDERDEPRISGPEGSTVNHS